jgi:hypothetical protein
MTFSTHLVVSWKKGGGTKQGTRQLEKWGVVVSALLVKLYATILRSNMRCVP